MLADVPRDPLHLDASRLRRSAPGSTSATFVDTAPTRIRVRAEPMNPLAPVTRTLSPASRVTVHPLRERALRHRLTELQDEAGVPVRSASTSSRASDEPLDLILAGDKWREQLHDVHVVRRDLRQDPVAVEEGHHDHLREQGRYGSSRHPPPHTQAGVDGLPEHEADHQALAPHFVQELVLLDEGSSAL